MIQLFKHLLNEKKKRLQIFQSFRWLQILPDFFFHSKQHRSVSSPSFCLSHYYLYVYLYFLSQRIWSFVWIFSASGSCRSGWVQLKCLLKKFPAHFPWMIAFWNRYFERNLFNVVDKMLFVMTVEVLMSL